MYKGGPDMNKFLFAIFFVFISNLHANTNDVINAIGIAACGVNFASSLLLYTQSICQDEERGDKAILGTGHLILGSSLLTQSMITSSKHIKTLSPISMLTGFLALGVAFVISNNPEDFSQYNKTAIVSSVSGAYLYFLSIYKLYRL